MDARSILSLAVEKEQAAYELYAGAAKLSSDVAAKELLADLAVQELRHRELLSGLDPHGLHGIEALSDAEPCVVAFSLNEPMAPGPRVMDLLAYAVRREREARDFYDRMAAAAHDDEHRGMFTKLARMEEGHRTRLECLHQSLIGDGDT